MNYTWVKDVFGNCLHISNSIIFAFFVLILDVYDLKAQVVQGLRTPLRMEIGAGVFVYQGDLTPKLTGSWRTIQPGLAISVRKQLTPRFQLLSGLTLGRLEGDDNKYKNEPAFRGDRRFSFTSTFAEAGFQLQWFLRHQDYERPRFSPFLQAGGAWFYRQVKYDASNLNQAVFPFDNFMPRLRRDSLEGKINSAIILPLGAGLLLPLKNNISVNISWSLRLPFTDYLDGFSFAANPEKNDFYHSFLASVAFPFSGKRKKATQEAPVITVKPAITINDSDRDGINDSLDICPLLSGFQRYKGCPIPDSDGDGLHDELDKCPLLYGLEKYKGCPIPDSDGDGVNDEADKCPNQPGIALYNGCLAPEAKMDLPNSTNTDTVLIGYFGSDRYSIDNNLYQKLDWVVEKLRFIPGSIVLLRGHSDDTGISAYNMQLSERRAAICKAYLMSRNVDPSRILTEAAGSSKPAVISEDPMVYWLNRRVEIIFKKSIPQ